MIMTELRWLYVPDDIRPNLKQIGEYIDGREFDGLVEGATKYACSHTRQDGRDE